MKATIIIEMAKDGGFSCYMREELPQATLIGFGSTVEECKEDLMASYTECREMYSDFPILQFVWRYDIASFLNFYNYLNVTQLSTRIGINASLLRRYKSGCIATQKTFDKFALGLKQIGKELTSTQF